jgi:hypothetical protein
VSKEESDIVVDQRGMDIVQNEHISRVREEREAESGLDPRLGPAGD